MNFQEWDVPKILHLRAPTKKSFFETWKIFSQYLFKNVALHPYISIKGK